MNIEDIVKTLDGKLVAGGDNGRTVGAVVANAEGPTIPVLQGVT